MKLHPAIRTLLGYAGKISDAALLKLWRNRTKNLCKPCWELKYCPYGPLVEDFPLPPLTLAETENHNDYLRECLKTGFFPDGNKVDKQRRRFFEEQLHSFRKSDYPDKIPQVIEDASCKVFGHLCPVYFTAEPLTETKDRRRHSRNISREVMLKVVRRDGQICQMCFEPVPDNKVEFDHIIPFSKGGPSTVGNLRLLCFDCNRKKRDSLSEILSENPIEHLFHIKKSASKKRRK
jgi:5-methylcytosine-specific restriction endonuclease McrA